MYCKKKNILRKHFMRNFNQTDDPQPIIMIITIMIITIMIITLIMIISLHSSPVLTISVR